MTSAFRESRRGIRLSRPRGSDRTSQRISNLPNCLDHQFGLFPHDPVVALFRDDMLTLRQVTSQGGVCFAPILWSRARRQDHNWLITKAAQFADERRTQGQVFELARNGHGKFLLNPKNRRHLSLNSRQGPKPRA